MKPKSENAPKLTYAETALIESLEIAPIPAGAGERILVAGNRSGRFTALAAAAAPDAALTAHAFDIHHAKAITARLGEAALAAPPTVICTAQVLPDPEAPRYTRAYFMTTPQSMSAELVLDQLQDIWLSLEDGGALYAAFEGDGDDALKTMRHVWKNVRVIKRTKRAILFKAAKTGEIAKMRDFASTWQASIPGGAPLEFTTAPGCFCHRRADAGGLALAEVAAREIKPGHAILDMGCGCGLVGLLVADAARRAGGGAFTGRLTAVDSHARAIAATALNAQRAAIPAETILSDDGLPRGQGIGEYDVFVGNPPYYSDYRIAETFLETAYRALKPGGVCYSVVKTASGLLSVQEKYFGSAETINRRGYCILRSVRL